MNKIERSHTEIIGDTRIQQEKLQLLTEQDVVSSIINAGLMMVVDPEEAAYDLEDTLERTRISIQLGMKVILVGGSTDNGEAEVVFPALRKVVDEKKAETLLLAFPGSSRQVVEGAHATLLLNLPQIYSILEVDEQRKAYFTKEKRRIIEKS